MVDWGIYFVSHIAALLLIFLFLYLFGSLVIQKSGMNSLVLEKGWQFFLSIFLGLTLFSLFFSIPVASGLFHPHLLSGFLVFVVLAVVYHKTPLPRPPEISWIPLEKNLFWVFTLFYLATSLIPVPGWDASVYHLPLIREIFLNGKIPQIPLNVYGHFPLSADIPYLLTYLLGTPMVSGGFHCMMGIFTLLFLRWVGGKIGFFLIWLLIHSEVYFSILPVAYVEHTLTFVLTFSFFLIRTQAKYPSSEGNKFLVGLVTALTAGFLIGSKFFGVLTAFALIFYLFLNKFPIKRVGFVCLLALLLGSPFYLRNLILTHNPVYPGLYSLFGGKGWNLEYAQGFQNYFNHFGIGRDYAKWPLIPYYLWKNSLFESMGGGDLFEGKTGPWYLGLIPLALLGWFFYPRIAFHPISLSLIPVFLGWLYLLQSLRHLLPVLPITTFFLLILAFRFSSLRKVVGLKKFQQIFLLTTLLPSLFHLFVLWERDLPKLRKISPLQSYGGVQSEYQKFASENCPAGKKILLLNENFSLPYTPLVIADPLFEFSLLKAVMIAAGHPEFFKNWCLSQGVGLIVFSTRDQGIGWPLWLSQFFKEYCQMVFQGEDRGIPTFVFLLKHG